MAVLKFVSEVVKNINITPTVFELYLRPSIEFPFEAGQFLMIDAPNSENPEKPLKRSYSIASPPEAELICLCIKHLDFGRGTPFFKNLKPGDKVNTAGPFGRFTYKTPPTKNAFFIATGTGISPFHSMMFSEKYKANPPQKTFVALGTRTEDELLYSDRLGGMPNVTWISTVSQPSPQWQGFKGRVTDYIRGLTDLDFANTEFYLCGNGDMIKEMKIILTDIKGVAKECIHQEIYY